MVAVHADTADRMPRALCVAFVAMALTACSQERRHGPRDASPDVDQPADASNEDAPADTPGALACGIDILFVVDDSPSMEEEQANLVKNFKAMIDVLKARPGGLPDVHLGVVSSSL